MKSYAGGTVSSWQIYSMPDRSKGRGQMKCGPWSSKLKFRRGANDPTPEKFTLTKPPEKYYHEGSQDPNRVVAIVKKKMIQRAYCSIEVAFD
jgi:hypothetical protein